MHVISTATPPDTLGFSQWVFRPPLTQLPGHHRPWLNEIHHDDIRYDNLMATMPPAKPGDPVNTTNDPDLEV